MDCKRFAELVPQYLAGKLGDLDFARMIEHESECEDCQQLAAAEMSEAVVEPQVESDRAQSDWLSETLDRTLGADCEYIETRLAGQIDGVKIDEMMAKHVDDCKSCRMLGRVLAELPQYYEAFPRLKVDRAFVPEIVERTIGRVPGILDVVRALLKRPEALIEGAVACALIAAPFAGDLPAKLMVKIDQAPQTVIQSAHIDDLSSSLDQRIAAANDHFASVSTERRQIIEQEFNDAQQWAHKKYDYITSTDPETGSPTAKAWQWTERALGRTGLIEVDKKKKTNEANKNPDSSSGTE